MKTSFFRINKFSTTIAATAALLAAQSSAFAIGGGTSLSWSEAMGDQSGISSWLHTILVAIMACFVMVSIILGSLAFKQLAADGNWKDFWSKIAGAIGMFVTPIAIYWIAGQ